MWSRTTHKEPDPAQAPGVQPAAPTGMSAGSGPLRDRAQGGGLIGKEMRIKGEIHSEESLAIEGEVEGSVELGSRLVVGEHGQVTAGVKAAEVDVRGSIQGNVEATTRVVIRKGAKIVGDVTTAGIVIEDGAYFKGGIDIAKPKAAG